MLQLKLFEDVKYLPEIWWDVYDIDWKIKKAQFGIPLYICNHRPVAPFTNMI